MFRWLENPFKAISDDLGAAAEKRSREAAELKARLDKLEKKAAPDPVAVAVNARAMATTGRELEQPLFGVDHVGYAHGGHIRGDDIEALRVNLPDWRDLYGHGGGGGNGRAVIHHEVAERINGIGMLPVDQRRRAVEIGIHGGGRHTRTALWQRHMKWCESSRHIGKHMGSYAAEIERSDIFGGGGFSLRVVRREGGICGQLASMQWEQLEDGAAPTYLLSSADTGGDMAAFLQAVMDAAWRAGVRPTSFSADEQSHVKTIESQAAHIKGLERQVNMQHQYIEKLLAK